MCIRFADTEVRAMGRQSIGVIGIKLRETDAVVGMQVLQKGTSIMTVTELGYGKRTKEDEYPQQGRAGMGVITIKTTERNGRVAGAIQVNAGDQAMIDTDRGTLIRMRTDDVSEIGRNTQGVRLIHVERGEKVMSIARIAPEPGDENASIEGAPVAFDASGGETAPIESDADGAEPTDDEGEA
jgi:DNA gyrase subunit A